MPQPRPRRPPPPRCQSPAARRARTLSFVRPCASGTMRRDSGSTLVKPPPARARSRWGAGVQGCRHQAVRWDGCRRLGQACGEPLWPVAALPTAWRRSQAAGARRGAGCSQGRPVRAAAAGPPPPPAGQVSTVAAPRALAPIQPVIRADSLLFRLLIGPGGWGRGPGRARAGPKISFVAPRRRPAAAADARRAAPAALASPLRRLLHARPQPQAVACMRRPSRQPPPGHSPIMPSPRLMRSGSSPPVSPPIGLGSRGPVATMEVTCATQNGPGLGIRPLQAKPQLPGPSAGMLARQGMQRKAAAGRAAAAAAAAGRTLRVAWLGAAAPLRRACVRRDGCRGGWRGAWGRRHWCRASTGQQVRGGVPAPRSPRSPAPAACCCCCWQPPGCGPRTGSEPSCSPWLP